MEWIKKLNTREGKEKFFIMILSGILLLVIFLPIDKKQEETPKTDSSPVKDVEDILVTETEDYAENLEKRLAKTLSYMEGAGNIKVMITLKASEEQVVEKDTPGRRSSEIEKGDGLDRTSSEYETEETTVYITDEEGNQTPYVIQKMEPVVEGVVVIASGGGNGVVKKNITEIIQSLFGIEPHKIRVVKMKTIQ